MLRENLLRFSVPLIFLCALPLETAYAQRPAAPSLGRSPQLAELSLSAQYSALGAEIGTSVAIGGNTVVVGTPFVGFTGDAAFVYVQPASGWTNMTQTAVLVPSDGTGPPDDFGISVAITSDASTIVVGASQSNPNYVMGPGKAYVFVRPAGGWSGVINETAKLTASDAATGDAFATSVSISGNTIVAGSPGSFPFANAGAAYVFVEPVGGWKNSTETAKLTTSDGRTGDQFGASASISGNTVVGGAPLHLAGRAYVFVEPSGGWVNATQNAELSATGQTSASYLGFGVAIQGGAVIAGAPYAVIGSNKAQGAAYLYIEPAGGWKNMTQSSTLLAPDGQANDTFGSAVAISGNRAVIGAPTFARGQLMGLFPVFWREGAVYSFKKAGSGSTITRMNGADSRYDDLLGTSVGISGNIVVSGAPNLGHYTGSTFIFGVQ